MNDVNLGRRGTSPAELRALWRVIYSLGGLQPSLVVQLGMWPEKPSEWARALKLDPSQVYNTLSGYKSYNEIRAGFARRLGVPPEAMDHLIDRSAAATTHDLPPVPEGLEMLVELAQSGQLAEALKVIRETMLEGSEAP